MACHLFGSNPILFLIMNGVEIQLNLNPNSKKYSENVVYKLFVGVLMC